MEIFRLNAEVTTLLNRIVLPDSNNPDLQKTLADYYIGDVLSGLAKRKDKAKETLVKAYASQLKEPMDTTTLVTIRPFDLTAKVTNPRETFDLSAFIKAVSDKYEISASDLHNIAGRCTKKSKPPVSLKVDIHGSVGEQ